MRFRKLTMLVAVGLFGTGAPLWAQSDVSGSTPPSNPQVSQPDQGGVNWKGVGVGAGTAAGNMLYVPAKIAYGILGGIAGGAGYALTGGNKQVADTIWRSSLGGDYVLTPDMVTGKKPIHFSGPTDTAQPDNGAAAAPAGTSGSTMQTSSAAAPVDAPISSTESTLGTHPIDSGAGPVAGSTALSAPGPASHRAASSSLHDEPISPSPKSAPPLPSTSIE
jgi:hypothetical protein